MTGVIVAADTMSLSELVDYGRRLEALGYDSVWIPDMFGARRTHVTAGAPALAHRQAAGGDRDRPRLRP